MYREGSGPYSSETGLFNHETNRQPPAAHDYRARRYHITIPQHSPLRIGTLSAILTDVALHFELTREQLHQQLFE